MVTWEQFREQIERDGFVILEEETFSCRGKNPHRLVAAHPQKKLLFFAVSNCFASGEEAFSDGSLYGTLQYTNEELILNYLNSDGGGTGDLDRENRLLFLDAHYLRDDVVTMTDCINKLGKVGTFVDWHSEGQDRFIYLLDYIESNKTNGDSWRQRRDEFLERTKPWVKKFIL